MATSFRLPDVGEGVSEGEISKWLVEEGDEVEEDQLLVEVLTEKVNVELPSPRKGQVLKILVDEGEMVPVGETLVVIGEEGEEWEEEEPKEEPPEKEEEEPEEEAAEPPEEPEEREEAPSRVLAAPATRRLARELGVDLQEVQGSGPAGRITKEDVERAAEEEERPTERVPVEAERIPYKGIRRRIGQNMAESKRTAAHVTHFEEVDVTELVELRQKAKEVAERKGIRLTFLPFIVKAVTAALKQHPKVNSELREDEEEIVLKKEYNVGIATDTEDGLMVPVVKDADRKSVYRIAEEVEELVGKAREGDLELEDVRGGTFTVTNVGPIGGVMSTPIIRPPEVAILGVHQFRKKPVVLDDGEIAARDMTFLAVSFDHRVLDGAEVARFTNTLKEYLENPTLLLLGD